MQGLWDPKIQHATRYRISTTLISASNRNNKNHKTDKGLRPGPEWLLVLRPRSDKDLKIREWRNVSTKEGESGDWTGMSPIDIRTIQGRRHGAQRSSELKTTTFRVAAITVVSLRFSLNCPSFNICSLAVRPSQLTSFNTRYQFSYHSLAKVATFADTRSGPFPTSFRVS